MTKEELYKALKDIKIEMTPKERIKEYLKGNEVDCIPYGFLAPEDAMAAMWGYSNQKIKYSFDIKCQLKNRIKEEYGFSGISASMGLRGIGEAVGSKIECSELGMDYVSDYIVKNYTEIDFEEPLDVNENSFLREKLNEGKRLQDCFPNEEISTDVAGPISTAAAIRPVELLLRDMKKRPEKLHRLLQYAVDCSLAWVEKFVEETGGRSVSISDPVTTTDILGYKYFREYSRPYFEKLFWGIHNITGAKPSVHICGHTKKIWNDLMEIGVDNFSLDNCEQIEEAKFCMGEKVFLSGNVPPVDVMLKGSIDEVMESVKTTIEKASDNPKGFMLMTGCQVPIGTPKENFDAYVLAAHLYGRDAKLGKQCKK